MRQLDFFVLAKFLVHHSRLELVELEFLMLKRACFMAVFKLCTIDIVHGDLLGWLQRKLRRTARRYRKPGYVGVTVPTRPGA